MRTVAGVVIWTMGKTGKTPSACQFKLRSGRAQMVLTPQADGTYKTGGICTQMAWGAKNEASR